MNVVTKMEALRKSKTKLRKQNKTLNMNWRTTQICRQLKNPAYIFTEKSKKKYCFIKAYQYNPLFYAVHWQKFEYIEQCFKSQLINNKANICKD